MHSRCTWVLLDDEVHQPARHDDHLFRRGGRDAPGVHRGTRSNGSSNRSESANARSANLLAEYDAMPASTFSPAPELMKIT